MFLVIYRDKDPQISGKRIELSESVTHCIELDEAQLSMTRLVLADERKEVRRALGELVLEAAFQGL